MHETQCYEDTVKPKLARLLRALGLDQHFPTAALNSVFDADGREVLDLVGGFGACLLGHNPPALKKKLIADIEADVAGFVPVSTRADAAELSARLNQELAFESGHSGQRYLLNLANSGAEAVEFVIKHAYLVATDAVGRRHDELARAINDFKFNAEELLDAGRLKLPAGQPSLRKFCDRLAEHNLLEFEYLKDRPVIAALKGSFHGKTTSALKVTSNKSYREPFEGMSGVQTEFIDRPERLSEVVREQQIELRYPIIDRGRVVVRSLRFTRVIGFIFETIRGEGGVLPVPDADLQRFAELHGELGVPYIVDEIQTGCGRCGRVFDHTQTPLKAIQPEYLLLGKTLGGGMAKTAATLIRKDIHEPVIDLLHSSTFAEDAPSTRLAIASLDQLTANDGAMLRRVDELGTRLRNRLDALRKRFPRIIREVRGRGLMIGVEFTALDDASPFLRAAGHQGVLSLLVASYLLRYHAIRLIAPLSTMLPGNPGRQRRSVLRIQPPATLTEADVERLIAGLTEVLSAIERNNEYLLVGHLSGHPASDAERAEPTRFDAQWPLHQHKGPIDARVGFIAHPTSVAELVEYYFPSFEHYGWDADRVRDWWNRLSPFLEPQHARVSHVRSNGFVVELNLVFVPYLPEYLTGGLTPKQLQAVRDKIQDAVTLAKERGDDNIPVTVVGLGGYTSIMTDNGRTLDDHEVPITTGNAYTALLVLEGLAQAAEEQGVDLSRSTVAVVGAAGNIGQVLAQMLAGYVGRLDLVARPGERSQFKLKMSRRAVFEQLLSGWRGDHEAGDGAGEEPGGELSATLRAAIIADGEQALLDPATDKASAVRRLELLFERWFSGDERPPIRLATGLDAIAGADLVAVATNSPDPELIQPEMVKQDAIVCCASVPSNLSRRFADSGHFAVDVGLALLSDGSVIDMVGFPKHGLAYACLAETLLCGLDGRDRSFSKGPLGPPHIWDIAGMSVHWGFSLGAYRRVTRPAPSAVAAPATHQTHYEGELDHVA